MSGLLLALAGCAGAPGPTATASVGTRTDSVLAPARTDAGAEPAARARATPQTGIGAQPLFASLWSTDMPLSPAEQDAVIAVAIASHEMRHP